MRDPVPGTQFQSSSSSPTTISPQTLCASPPLRPFSKACSFVAAFGERTHLSTMCPVCSANYVPGLDPRSTRLTPGADISRRFASRFCSAFGRPFSQFSGPPGSLLTEAFSANLLEADLRLIVETLQRLLHLDRQL